VEVVASLRPRRIRNVRAFGSAARGERRLPPSLGVEVRRAMYTSICTQIMTTFELDELKERIQSR
jgi:predicted nucleotidyltransferase